MTYGPPGNQPPGPPPGEYGPPPGGQGASHGGGYGGQQGGGYGAPQGGGYGGQQGGYGAPQGGYSQPAPGYGPPGSTPGYGSGGGGYGGAKKGFDPKTVNPLDWVALAAGILAFIFSFISFYSVGANASGSSCPAGLQSEIDRGLSASDTTGTAWHGFFGWFGTILALLGAALIALVLLAPQVKLPFPARLVALGAFALATLSTLLALFVDPVTLPPDVAVSSGCKVAYEIGHGFGYWASLIIIAVGTVAAFLRFQQSGGQLPGVGAKSGPSSSSGAPGYGQQQGYQPPQIGYQPPQQQGPPPGYQAPRAGYQYPPQEQGYQNPPQQQGYQNPPQQQGPPPAYQPPPPPQQPSFQPPPPQQPGYQPPSEQPPSSTSPAEDVSQTQVLPPGFGQQPPQSGPPGGYGQQPPNPGSQS